MDDQALALVQILDWVLAFNDSWLLCRGGLRELGVQHAW
jgi:hypothetical protein